MQVGWAKIRWLIPHFILLYFQEIQHNRGFGQTIWRNSDGIAPECLPFVYSYIPLKIVLACLAKLKTELKLLLNSLATLSLLLKWKLIIFKLILVLPNFIFNQLQDSLYWNSYFLYIKFLMSICFFLLTSWWNLHCRCHDLQVTILLHLIIHCSKFSISFTFFGIEISFLPRLLMSFFSHWFRFLWL